MKFRSYRIFANLGIPWNFVEIVYDFLNLSPVVCRRSIHGISAKLGGNAKQSARRSQRMLQACPERDKEHWSYYEIFWQTWTEKMVDTLVDILANLDGKNGRYVGCLEYDPSPAPLESCMIQRGWRQSAVGRRCRVPRWRKRSGSTSRKTSSTLLVERFDIELLSDFSAKWSNFVGLVLFCIDAKFSKKIIKIFVTTRSTEIYKMYMLLHRSDLNISATCVKLFRIFRQSFPPKRRYFLTFFIEFRGDFDEIFCFHFQITLFKQILKPNILEYFENFRISD